MTSVKVSVLSWAWQTVPVCSSSGPPGTGPGRAAAASAITPVWKGSSASLSPPTPVSSLEALCHVGQGDCKGLHGREGVLEVQNVRAAVDPPKLHHLGGREAKTLQENQVGRGNRVCAAPAGRWRHGLWESFPTKVTLIASRSNYEFVRNKGTEEHVKQRSGETMSSTQRGKLHRSSEVVSWPRK